MTNARSRDSYIIELERWADGRWHGTLLRNDPEDTAPIAGDRTFYTLDRLRDVAGYLAEVAELDSKKGGDGPTATQ